MVLRIVWLSYLNYVRDCNYLYISPKYIKTTTSIDNTFRKTHRSPNLVPLEQTCLVMIVFCVITSSAERHCRYHKKERNCHNNSIYEPLNDIIIIIFLFHFVEMYADESTNVHTNNGKYIKRVYTYNIIGSTLTIISKYLNNYLSIYTIWIWINMLVFLLQILGIANGNMVSRDYY